MSDGSVSWSGVKMSPSDDDPAVMEIARSVAGDDDVVALTVGDGDVAWAAARGAASTVVVDGVDSNPDGSVIGSILAAGIGHIGDADVVVIGDSDWDYAVVSSLIGKLGWNAVAGVIAADVVDGALLVTRKSATASQIVRVEGPAVLAVKALQSEQNAPGMKQTLAARKRPVECLTVSDIGGAPSSKGTSDGTRLPDTASAIMIDGSNPAAAVEQLLTALRGEGVI